MGPCGRSEGLGAVMGLFGAVFGPCVEVQGAWGRLWGPLEDGYWFVWGGFGSLWESLGFGGSYGVIWGGYGAMCGGLGFGGSYGVVWGSYGALWGVVMGPCGAVWGQLWGSVGRFGGFVVSAKLAMKANRHLLQGSVPSAPQINPC